MSPERKAAEILRTFFTFVAVKVIMAQMRGAGRGDLGAYNGEGYARLEGFLMSHPLRSDGDAWVAALMLEDEMLGEGDGGTRMRFLRLKARATCSNLPLQDAPCVPRPAAPLF